MRAGVCTPITKQFEFICDVDWMKAVKVRGVVIGRTVLFSCPAAELPQNLFRHELEHAYQQVRDGRFWFYLKYFYYQIRYGYQKNPYEKEARYRANATLTTTEEQLLWKLREG